MHLNAIVVPSLIRKFGRMRGIRCPAGCHDGDAHNWDLAYHAIINEVLVVACELVRAPLCRSMFIKNNIREFLASLLYFFLFFFIFFYII